MLEIIIWLAGFFCPNPTHTLEHHGNCNLIHVGGTVTTNGDTGGENGGTPKPPVPPPPPPPPLGGN